MPLLLLLAVLTQPGPTLARRAMPSHAASARGADDAWRTDLRRYAGMPPQQRLSLLLSLLSADSLAEDLPDLLAPFLARLDSVGLGSGGGGDSEPEAAADSQLVLRRALEQEAARRLPWVVKLVQCEARLRCVFAGAAQLATAAAACCYASTVRPTCVEREFACAG